MKKTIALIATVSMLATNGLYAQINTSQDVIGRDGQSNIIMTAASFLTIAPDSRAGGLGDAGVATTPDTYSQHWNPAKYLFHESRSELGLCYTPWLRKYVDDMSISYLAGFTKIRRNQAVGYSMTYFSLGDMVFTDVNGTAIKNFSPKEFAFDLSYSLKLADNLGAAVAMRYIYSNLTGGISVGGSDETHAGHSVAGDIAVYYHKNFLIGERSAVWGLGAYVSNIGTKMSYTSVNDNFIPTNLKLGTSLKFDFDEYNSVMFAFDANKLLVPTPPIYNATGDEILKGKDPDVSVPTGIFQSFGDAPGGFEEEMKEISYSFGAEYIYSNTLAGRVGYYSEHKDKGGRKYITVGFGLTLKAFTFDMAYLVTTTASNPLQNTIKFSLAVNFDKLRNNRVEER
ncbi:MAG: type IX secretion system outer membrane channel protein PorV [Bacteroidales bacterium]|nr:type IX secretion system outer membrane channel protein PorV [Bacteroidales bacterium]